MITTLLRKRVFVDGWKDLNEIILDYLGGALNPMARVFVRERQRTERCEKGGGDQNNAEK